MTIEQAIIQLEYRKDFATPDQIKALDMAISALSENKGNLIRRLEVESVLHNNLHALIDTDQLNQLYKDIDRLHAYSIPDSAENLNMEREQAYYRGYEDGIQKGRESAENKGEWIVVPDSYHEDGTIYESHWECSKCGSGRSGWGEFKFCPDCGADMRKSKRKPKGEKGE